jgi:alpha-tubulin suppressor-like RCC1 family protein
MSESSSVPSTTAFRVVPVPSFVACLSKSSNPEARLQSLLLNDVEEYPVNMSLSRCCSFVVTSIGRCFSFGTSEDGMLGLGRGITETRHPMEITMPEQARSEMITSVSAGAWHVTSCTKSGNVYSWGAQSHAGFAVPRPTSVLPSQQQPQRRPPTMKGPTPIEDLLRFEWSPRQVLFTPQIDRSMQHHSGLSNDTNVPIVQVSSGNDCTFFVTESGRVLSSGKSSGRLGQGEVDHDVTSPKPLFGGLHLFQQENNNNINHPLTIPRHRQKNHQHPIQPRSNGPTVEYSSFGVTIQAV